MTGDSLTYGFWVDDEAVVSSQLSDMLGDEWQVINLGVGGYGTGQGFLRYLRDGARHDPQIVVHTLFNNDFSNIVSNYQYNVFKPQFQLTEQGMVLNNVPVPKSDKYEQSYLAPREPPYTAWQRFMRSWSHLYVLYKDKMGKVKAQVRGVFSPPQKLDYHDTYKDGEHWAIEREYSQVMQYAFQLNANILLEYKKRVEQDNATFILVVVGDQLSVDPQARKANEDRFYNVDSSFFDYDKPYRLLEQFANDNNITIVNLYPKFLEEFSQGKSMYLEGDHHLNDYGHQLFAQAIYEKIEDRGILS